MDGMDTANCTCDLGFTGDQCQTNIDDCVGVDCSGNGQCVDGVNNFTCQCTAGFSGRQCSESKFVILIVYIILYYMSSCIYSK